MERAYSVTPVHPSLSAYGVSNLCFKFFRRRHLCPLNTFLVTKKGIGISRLFFILKNTFPMINISQVYPHFFINSTEFKSLVVRVCGVNIFTKFITNIYPKYFYSY